MYPQLLPALVLTIAIISASCVAFPSSLLELLNIHTDVEGDQKQQQRITFCKIKKTEVLGQTKMPAQHSVARATHRVRTSSCQDWLVVVDGVRLDRTSLPPLVQKLSTMHTPVCCSLAIHVFTLVGIFLGSVVTEKKKIWRTLLSAYWKWSTGSQLKSNHNHKWNHFYTWTFVQ